MIEKSKEPLPSKKRSILKKTAKFLGIFFFITILLFVIAVFALDNYLQSNKAKIFEQLTFLNNGDVSFNEAQISIYKDFPNATISLRNVLVTDSLFPGHQIPFLKVDELRAALSLGKLWEKEVELKSIELHNGQVNIHTDSSGYKLLQALIPKPSKPKPTNNKSLAKGFKLRTDPLDVSLFKVDINIIDVTKKSSIRGQAEQLLAQLHINDKGISAEVDMQLSVKEMTFNKDKGTFIKDSKLNGKTDIHIQNGIVIFDPFDLKINDELFTFNGRYDTKKKTQSKLVLVNKNTRWKKVLPLLTDSIQLAITPYFIQHPFYTKTVIKGSFISGTPATVDINFQIDTNEVKAFDFDLDHVDIKGRFVNRFYKNESDTIGRRGIRLEFGSLALNYQDFQIRSQNTIITGARKTIPHLLSDLKVSGKSKTISDVLSNDQFFFNKGNFSLSAQLNGPINDYNQLMINSDASLELSNINVYYKPADVVFPFKQLGLRKKSGDADFHLVSSTPDKKYNFQLVGLLNNLPALLINMKGQRASSQAKFDAQKIEWRDFVDWFGKKGDLKKDHAAIKVKSEKQKKKTMKQTIRGIEYKFRPRLSLNVDTLSYYDLIRIDNFLTNVYFEDDTHLILENTSFDYEKGSVNFSARLDLSDSLQTPFEFELHTQSLNLAKLLPPLDYFDVKLLANLEILPDDLNLRVKLNGIVDDQTGLIPNTLTGDVSFDIEDGELLAGKITYEPDLISANDLDSNKAGTNSKILLVGDPSLFNNFLKTDQFFFSKGRFFFTFDYRDDQITLENILNSSNVALKIRNSQVHYAPTGVNFPLTKIDLSLKSNEADFDILVRSDSLQRQIQLKGMIQNLSELVIGNTGKSIKTEVDIISPRLNWDRFFHLFVPEPTDTVSLSKKEKMDALKETVGGFFGHFDPTITAKVDTLKLTDKFTIMNFNAGIHMTESNKLILEEIAFDYFDGSASVDGQFDFNATGSLPFNAHFNTLNLDVEKLLISLDYLSLPSLKSIDKLSGQITMDLDIAGLIADDGSGLIPEATIGLLDVQLNDVELAGMATLDTLAAKIGMKKRFADLRFAPIENRFTIDGHHVGIPLMEIQSNAINLFMEGTLSYTDQTNIWISIPLDNLKKADRSIVPEKRGWAATKNKVYIEVTSDEKGNNKFKLRTSKKKFYKSRGISSQYREDKKKYRKIRKDQKKQNRK